jgi:MFS family permease
VLQPDAWLSLALIGVASFWITFPFALITAALQRVTPNEMRGLVAGVYVVMVSVMGLGLGPTLVAVLTDSVFQDPAAVGKSLALMFAGVGPLAVLLLASGMSSYAATLREVESAQ